MRFAKYFFLVLLLAGMTSQLVTAQEPDKSAYVAGATSKFQNFPGIPQCAMASAQRGDPAKGNAVLLLKAQTGCVVPWHWHTPVESLMMVSGRAKVEMKDGDPVTLRPGDFVYLTAKHVHQFTCQASCMMFDMSEGAPFDIHYVDASGNEIPAEQALKSKAKPGAKKSE